MSFVSLGLSEALAGALEAAGYAQPTPVQQRAIPAVLQKRDLMVAAQTGTGKTAGFALPVLELLFPGGQPSAARPPQGARQTRVLVLTPTRELAAQVHDSFQLYAKQLPFKSACIFGGVSLGPQVRSLAPGVDVLVACPGRLLDLVGQGSVDLSCVEILVLDEADRMLDMGFIHDVKRVLARLPSRRQNLLFSATFSADILALADRLLHDPERIEVTPPNTTVERIEQHVYRIGATLKRALLAHLIAAGQWEQVLVFTRTKHGANRLAEYLSKCDLPAAAIHGNKSQNARTRALADFKENRIRVLVATDIAARGLDIDQLPHVVNFELPNVEEDYVHRIGRTGRAGRDGEAISLVSPDEEKLLRNIERLIHRKIPEGDLKGFDPTSLEQEKAPAQKAASSAADAPAADRGAQAAQRNKRSRVAKPKAQGAEEEKTSAQPRRPRGPRPQRPDRPAQTSSSVGSFRERDPEEFLDDDVDNFGNRVDYVSPYQGERRRSAGRSNTSAQGRTGGAAGASSGTNGRSNNAPRRTTGAAAGSAPQAQGATKPAAGARPHNAGAGSSGKPRAAVAKTAGQSGQGKPHAPRTAGQQTTRSNNSNNRRPRQYGQERQLTPFERTGNSAEQAKPRQQPVIVRKESKLERLSAAQLEQLENQGVISRGQGEKPVLLKRSPSS